MKPELPPPSCSGCGRPAHLVARATRFRRGERVLLFDGWIWECPSGCPDPGSGDVPYQFSTFTLMEWEEEQARLLWRERYGEPMPPSQRAHSPQRQRRVRVPVLLTSAEAERLDRARGNRTRSEYLRLALEEVQKKAV